MTDKHERQLLAVLSSDIYTCYLLSFHKGKNVNRSCPCLCTVPSPFVAQVYPSNHSSEGLLTLEANTVALCCNSFSSLQPEQCFTGAATTGEKEILPLRMPLGKTSMTMEEGCQDRKELLQKVQHLACCAMAGQRGGRRPRRHQKRILIKELKKYSANCTELKSCEF